MDGVSCQDMPILRHHLANAVATRQQDGRLGGQDRSSANACVTVAALQVEIVRKISEAFAENTVRPVSRLKIRKACLIFISTGFSCRLTGLVEHRGF